MRARFLVSILAFAVLPASAMPPCRGGEGLPEPGAPPAAVPYRFHRSDAGLGCVLPPATGEAMARRQQAVSFLPCLRVGAVAIADPQSQVEDVLGPPASLQTLGDDVESRVYPIPQRTMPWPQYVVTYRDKVVVAVQLLGPPTEFPALFSGLALGDPVQAVLDRLGRPARRCLLRPQGPETWMWPAFPIGIDIADGRVVGMKATWPAGRPLP